MANYISVSITLVVGQSTFSGVNIAGTTYPASILATNTNFADDVQAFLDGLGFGNIWTVLFDSETGILTINTSCMQDGFGPTPIPYVIINDRVTGENTFDFSIVSCENTDCSIGVCDYQIAVATCDYTISYASLLAYEEAISVFGATIQSINITPSTNILPAPIVCSDYVSLIIQISSILQNLGFDTSTVGANVNNAFIELKNIVVNVNTGNPEEPILAVTLDFVTENCDWYRFDDVYESNTDTLFPANFSVDINGNVVTENGVTSFSNLFTELGNVSFGPWSLNSGLIFVSGSPYVHTSPTWATDYFYLATGYPELAGYELTLQIIEINCRTEEGLDITGSLTINCEDTSCILFKDTTGLYNAVTNLGGYGYPNYPGFSEILSTEFTLIDNTNTVTIGTHNFDYLPTEEGRELCLTVSEFASGFSLVPGNSYTLEYSVFADNGDKISCLEIPFVMSYCGATLDSDIVIDFQPKQNPGCSKLTICDTTGEYDAEDNPTGYCGVNPCYDDIEYISVKFVLPNGDIAYIYPEFIPSETSKCFDVTAEQLGFVDGVIPDGIYEITYTVHGAYDSVIGTKTYKTLLFCQTKSCLDSTGRILLSDCPTLCAGDDIKKAIDKWIKLRLKLDEIIYASTVNIDCVEGEIEKLLKECQKGCYGC